ncbi:prepilin-type N-terminal cleavage/methylation domain-containing protein [Salinicola aestuarinus]|uniref:prepilin-type N-terminal cleavage/methylation domain-containing protein n=1 Tax=Salinicola aestuarinus TaxID=1949082 RepID=UPI000DA127CA|nr:prepilin-type N-terminal cleavage/methylation domain-containing protein [Salinicola aestuarinus]
MISKPYSPVPHSPPPHSPNAVAHGAERGFTLLEVLIAIALTALVGLGVAALVNGLTNARERFDEPLALSDDLRWLRRVDRRLKAVVMRPVHESGQPQLNARLDYATDSRSLEWVALADTPVPLGDHYTRLRRQRLTWLPDQRRLMLTSAGLLDAATTPDWQVVAVLDDVSRIDWAFFDGSRWNPVPATPLTLGARLTWWRDGNPVTLTVRLPEATS